MPGTRGRGIAVLAAFALIITACSDDDSTTTDTGDDTTATAGSETTDASDDTASGDTAGETEDTTGDTGGDTTSDTDVTSGESADGIDYEALGLWDDGPCDASLDPLIVGNMTTQESPVISLIDHVYALEAAAEAFNARGGANGACIQVVACDDKANFDQALVCVKELDDAGVVATVNDLGGIAQAEVSAGMAEAGIPRVGANVSPQDWGDQNSYPIGASFTGLVLLLPESLIQQGITEIGMVRVDFPEAAVMGSLYESIYGDQGATFPADIPIPAGTTDYTQFILAAEDAGATGIVIATGEQEAVQVVRASDQLASDLQIAASLGSFSYSNISELGDTSDRMTFVWGFAPATADVPVYAALRDDLAASGEETIQPETLKAGAMMSWVALYGLLRIIRDAGTTEFTGESIKALLEEAKDVPMLGIFGDETWTPDTDYPGQFQRAGIDRWTYWNWDPDAEWNGNPGNWVLGGEISFSETTCGSVFGAPEPC